MSAIDDSRLLRLAQAPARDLLPVFDRASMMRPLVWVLAFVPALIGIQGIAPSNFDAVYGLRVLQLYEAGNLVQFLDTSQLPSALPLGQPIDQDWQASQPPMTAWLSYGAERLLAEFARPGIFLISYISTAILLLTIFQLVRRHMNAREAVIAAIMLSFYGPMLETARIAQAPALGIAFGLLATIEYFRHLSRQSGLASWSLLRGGILLGLSFLASGPVALAIMLILFICAALRRPKLTTGAPPKPRALRRAKVNALIALLVLFVTAFAAAGWWPLMMASGATKNFWTNWLWGWAGMDVPYDLDPVQHSPFMILESLGVLSVAALFGFGHVLRRAVTGPETNERRWMVFLIAWTLVALAMLALWRMRSQFADLNEGPWKIFALLPCFLRATYTLNRIALREAGLFTASTCLGGGILIHLMFASPAPFYLLPHFQKLVLLLCGVVLLIVLWGLVLKYGRFEYTRHRLGAFFLAVLVILHVRMGLGEAGNIDPQQTELYQIIASISTHEEPRACVIVSEYRLPLALAYCLKDLWPDAKFQMVRTTDALLNSSEMSDSLAEQQKVAIVIWGTEDLLLRNIVDPTLRVEQLSTPQFYRGRELRVQLMNWTPESALIAGAKEEGTTSPQIRQNGLDVRNKNQ